MTLAIAILVLTALWRVITVGMPELGNFSPVMALALCAGLYTRNRWLWVAPFAALVLSDLYIDHWYAVVYRYEWSLQGELIRIACFVAALGIGLLVSRRRNWAGIIGGTLGASLLFYLVTNTASWASDAAYAHSLAGWFQAMTVGHPEYPSTIFFYKNTLISDLLFVAVFALGMEYQALRRGERSLLGLKQVGG